ncbi:MAG: hypothetical protein ACLFPQ_06200 [Candidatus Woesearchaeota archaeon]
MNYNEDCSTENLLKEKRERVMNTLGILNNGSVNLDQSENHDMNSNIPQDQPNNVMNENPVINQQAETKPQNIQAVQNTPSQPTSAREMSNNHDINQSMQMINEFMNMKKEIKNILDCFNQNISGIRQEIEGLKSQFSSLKSSGNAMHPQMNQQSNQNNQDFHNNNQGHNPQQMQMQNNNSSQQMNAQASQQKVFSQSHQVDSKEVSQSSGNHPRTGMFGSDDVKIENIFYYGNK